MAWLSLDPNEENTGAANAASGSTAPGQPINPSQGAAGFAGSGGGAGAKVGATAGSPTAAPGGGGGYTNLSSYLAANQGGQATQAVNNNINQGVQGEQNAINSWSGTNDAAVAAGTPTTAAYNAASAGITPHAAGSGTAPTVSYSGPSVLATPTTGVAGDPATQAADAALQGTARNASGAAGFGGYQALASQFGGGGLSSALINGTATGAAARNAQNTVTGAQTAANNNYNTLIGNAQRTTAADNAKLASQWGADIAKPPPPPPPAPPPPPTASGGGGDGGGLLGGLLHYISRGTDKTQTKANQVGDATAKKAGAIGDKIMDFFGNPTIPGAPSGDAILGAGKNAVNNEGVAPVQAAGSGLAKAVHKLAHGGEVPYTKLRKSMR